MEKVRKIIHAGKEILILDYAGSKPDKMIEIFDTAKRLILTEGKQVMIVSIFGKNYITPGFMRHVKKEAVDVESLIHKNAVVGLSQIQKWILKGTNAWKKRQLIPFDTLDDAINFLVTGEVAALE